MSGKLMITSYQNNLYTVLYSENAKALEINCYQDDDSILDNIYIGKVKDVVKYLNAVFIEYAPGKVAYCQINENIQPCFIKKGNSKKICAGDEILIQISKEAIKTKDPVATMEISLQSKYLILTSGSQKIGFSRKIKQRKWKENVALQLEQLIAEQQEEAGFIIRTDAVHLSLEELKECAYNLIQKWKDIKEKARYRTCFSLIQKALPGYLKDINNTYETAAKEILTDQKDLYLEIQEFLIQKKLQNVFKLSFYEDALLPLYKCYHLEGIIEEATQKKIWLKSGAYLIIEPTEALTVIDVNTGKCVSKKNNQEVLYKINLEAAREIAHILRLRNISGIIVIDFINMDEKNRQKDLLQYLQQEVEKDPIKCNVIDLTPLGLMELTRKKVKRSFREQIAKKNS